MKNQRGFTIIELLYAILGISWLCVIGGVIYAVCHFISKFW